MTWNGNSKAGALAASWRVASEESSATSSRGGKAARKVRHCVSDRSTLVPATRPGRTLGSSGARRCVSSEVLAHRTRSERRMTWRKGQ